MMQNPRVTFIHSLFRSGSTYFFEAVRRSSPSHICFQEAFHEVALKYADDPTQLISDRNSASDAQYRHPPLSAPYFAELVRAWPSWVGKLHESDIYKHYFRFASQSCGQDFWKSLVESTQKPVVFEETRTTGRIGALKYYFPDSLAIYLLRNPWDQWFSYKASAYFDATIQAIINAESRPASCSYVAQLLGLKKFDSDSLFDELNFYQNNALAPPDSYLAFFVVWCLALLEASEYADIVVKMDQLNYDQEYRQSLLHVLSSKGINVTFDDFCLAQSLYIQKDADFFEPLEERAYDILLRSGWKDSHIALIQQAKKGVSKVVQLASDSDSVGMSLVAKSSSALRSLYLEASMQLRELREQIVAQAREHANECDGLREQVVALESLLAQASRSRKEAYNKISATINDAKMMSG